MAVLSFENSYYRLLETVPTEGGAVFRAALLPGSPVYRGHFPGRPVSPGVCQVELIRQCAERLTGQRLRIASVLLCRFTAVASPSISPEVEVGLVATPAGAKWRIEARVSDAERVYVEYKGEMEPA